MEEVPEIKGERAEEKSKRKRRKRKKESVRMDFCPDCGRRLTSTRKKEGKKVTLQLICPKCGYKKRAPAVIPKVIERVPPESITVIGKEEQKLRTLPTIRIGCPKCGHNRAYVWQVQTRESEESSTQFFRCTKCNHTFREYS